MNESETRAEYIYPSMEIENIKNILAYIKEIESEIIRIPKQASQKITT